MGAIGCTSTTSAARVPEQLYLKIEVQQHGKTVAAPHLLGFEGRHIIVEKKAPQATSPDYRLVLLPREEGSGYGVKFDIELPNGRQKGGVSLLHGEERSVMLADDMQLKVMLMRVDSPEFRAMVSRTGGPARGSI
jgi:hypothetical protein